MAYFSVYASATLVYLASTFRFNVDVIEALGDIMDGKDTKIYGDLAEVNEIISDTEDTKASQDPLLGQVRALLNKTGSLRGALSTNAQQDTPEAFLEISQTVSDAFALLANASDETAQYHEQNSWKDHDKRLQKARKAMQRRASRALQNDDKHHADSSGKLLRHNANRSTLNPQKFEADYIIVGAGTAGSVVAERLSKAGHSVILLERGASLPVSMGDQYPNARCTACVLDDDLREKSCKGQDWCALNNSDGIFGAMDEDETLGWLNIRYGLGGTSSYSLGIRPSGGDALWESYASRFGKHWTFNEERSKRIHLEFSLRPAAELDADHTFVVDAGLKTLGGTKDTCERYILPNGWATNAYTQILKDLIKRPGIKLLRGVVAQNIMIENGTATSVWLKRREGTVPGMHIPLQGQLEVDEATPNVIAKARKEVIVSAGAVGSGALLMRSGIKAAPMKDQPDIQVAFTCSKCSFMKLFLQDWNKFTSQGTPKNGRVPKTFRLPGYDQAIRVDLEGIPALIFVDTSMTGKEYEVQKGVDREWDHSVLTILEFHIVLLQPKKFEHPITDDEDKLWNEKLALSDPRDVKAALKGIHLVRELMEPDGEVAKRLGIGKEVYPGANFKSDAQLTSILTTKGYPNSFQSATSSCAMGRVVDGNLRVMGVKQLRVVDASILPEGPLERPMFPTLMAADIAAERIILDENRFPSARQEA